MPLIWKKENILILNTFIIHTELLGMQHEDFEI